MYYTIEVLIDVLTIIAGTLGVVSVTFVGVQYLLAGNDKTKVARIKRHTFEIIIGFTAYALLFIISGWLLFS